MSEKCGEKPTKRGEPWSEEDLRYLADNFGLKADKEIAKHLQRTVISIQTTAHKRLPIKEIDNFFTASELGRVLGFLSSKKIVGWIQNGWLKSSHNRHHWVFSKDDIVNCLRQRPWLVDTPGETLKGHAHYWQLEKYETYIARGECQRCGAVRFFADVLDHEILERVNQLNNSIKPHYFHSIIAEEWERDPWYTTLQCASLLGVENHTVTRYIQRGWLPVDIQKPGGSLAYIIRRSTIEAFLKNDTAAQHRFASRSKANRSRLEKLGFPTRIETVWHFVCPECGQEVRIVAPPSMMGAEVREKFITVYVNGACFHSAKVELTIPP